MFVQNANVSPLLLPPCQCNAGSGCSFAILFQPRTLRRKKRPFTRTAFTHFPSLSSLPLRGFGWNEKPLESSMLSRDFSWRRVRDSNPSTVSSVTRFPVVRLRPLSQLSMPAAAQSARFIISFVYTVVKRKNDFFSNLPHENARPHQIALIRTQLLFVCLACAIDMPFACTRAHYRWQPSFSSSAFT